MPSDSARPYICVLIATRPRWHSLMNVALPSVLKQLRPPDEILIVTDRSDPQEQQLAQLRDILKPVPWKAMRNRRTPGVAGTWNTGLNDLRSRVEHHRTWVAILDDDDTWDAHHLECCAEHASPSAHVVISGLRCTMSSRELPREPLAEICTDDFLVGNPGWQGSNTFVRVDAMQEAGDFNERLTSCHDRDLAIRMLGISGLCWRLTGTMSATWHLGLEPDALSNPLAAEKHQAIHRFFLLHGHRMSADVRRRFDERNRDLFRLDSRHW